MQEFKFYSIQHPKISGLTPVQQGPRFVGVPTAVIGRMIAPLVGNPYEFYLPLLLGEGQIQYLILLLKKNVQVNHSIICIIKKNPCDES